MLGKRRKRRETDGDVPTDAFSDIAFLLIIFFILTTVFLNLEGFSTDIPSGQEGEEKEDQLSLQIEGDGSNLKIMFNEDRVASVDEFREMLSKQKLLTKPQDERIVMVDASGEIPFESYFQYLAVIQKQGGMIAIVREEEEGEE